MCLPSQTLKSRQSFLSVSLSSVNILLRPPLPLPKHNTPNHLYHLPYHTSPDSQTSSTLSKNKILIPKVFFLIAISGKKVIQKILGTFALSLEHEIL
jgi:hypothetical protein